MTEVAVPLERIERRIYLIRDRKVMLDSNLAELYKVPTSRLNEAVKRNLSRFPDDFMFQLTGAEAESLISQTAMSKNGRGGRRTRPYAFTEHGVAMLSSVLSSDRAVQMNILIIRAFVKMRELLASQRELAARVEKTGSLPRTTCFGDHSAGRGNRRTETAPTPSSQGSYRFPGGGVLNLRSSPWARRTPRLPATPSPHAEPNR